MALPDVADEAVEQPQAFPERGRFGVADFLDEEPEISLVLHIPLRCGVGGPRGLRRNELARRAEAGGQRHQLIDVAGLGVEPDDRGRALRDR